MALFCEGLYTKSQTLPFDKEQVLSEIRMSLTSLKGIWLVIENRSSKDHGFDFLCIRDVPVNEEINITDNPFHHYRKVKTSRYQQVLFFLIEGTSCSADVNQTRSSALEVGHTYVIDSVEIFLKVLKGR